MHMLYLYNYRVDRILKVKIVLNLDEWMRKIEGIKHEFTHIHTHTQKMIVSTSIISGVNNKLNLCCKCLTYIMFKYTA